MKRNFSLFFLFEESKPKIWSKTVLTHGRSKTKYPKNLFWQKYPLSQAAHKSLIHDAIEEGDEEFLAEVLEALNKKCGQSENSLEAFVKKEDKAERNICIIICITQKKEIERKVKTSLKPQTKKAQKNF